MKILDKYTIKKVDTENISDEKLRNIFELKLEKWRESGQVLPKPTFENFKYHYKKKYPFYENLNYIISNSEDMIIGIADFNVTSQDSEAPESEKRSAGIGIRVSKKYRNNGIGTEALKVLLRNTDKYRTEKIWMGSELECGFNFCENLGGKESSKGYTYYLNLKNTDWDHIRSLHQNISDKNQDIHLHTINELSETQIEEYLQINTKFMKEISEYWKDFEFDEDFHIKESRINIKESIERGVKRVITYAKNEKNENIGVSVVICDPLVPEEVYTMISGVNKDYRKKGLCKLMKTELLLFIKKNHPEYLVMTTGNDEENTVMRKINSDLGFKQLPVGISYTFKTDQLKEKLGI